MSKKYIRTPEDIAKAAERQANREARKQVHRDRAAKARKAVEHRMRAERAEPAYLSLRGLGSLGIVGLKGSDADYLMHGLEARVDKSGGQVVTLPAWGNIQGEDLDVEQEADTFAEISKLRRSEKLTGLRVLAFLDFDFGDVKSTGIPAVTNRVIEIIKRQDVPAGKHDNLSILVIGQGGVDDLPHSSHFDSSQQHPVAEALGLRFGLDVDNELSVVPELKLATPATDPESMLSFAQHLPHSVRRTT